MRLTNNPADLNVNYFLDAKTDFQLYYSPFTGSGSGTARSVIRYDAEGLSPGSATYVYIEYCNPTDRTLAAPAAAYVGENEVGEFKLTWDNGTPNGDYKDAQVKVGNCATYGAEGLANANGGFWSYVGASYRDKPFHTIGIKKFEIWGIPNVEVVVSQGTTVCVGEKVKLQSKYKYKDATYKWFADGAEIGTSESELYEVLAEGTVEFKLEVTIDGNPFTSPVFEATAKNCCEKGAARQVIFKDDFGRFDMDLDPEGHIYYVWDYSDILNPVEVQKTTTDRYRYELDNPPIAHGYDGEGAVVDGWYTVAAHISRFFPEQLSGGGPDHLGWVAVVGGAEPSPINFDQSGEKEGAALFINLDPKSNDKAIYNREITNLCGGKTVSFEAWVTYFSDPTPNRPTIEVNLYDKSNIAGAQKLSVTPPLNGWAPLTADIDMTGNTLIMEIINKSGTQTSGNDLVLDDIKLMTCSAPGLELYFDLADLSTRTTACRDELQLITSFSSTFKAFYPDPVKFLFQYSTNPRNLALWTDIGTAGDAESMTFANFMESPEFAALSLESGDKLAFRVVAATQTILDGLKASGTVANLNDPCKNYSVSPTILATVACPTCTMPEFTGMKVTAPEDTVLCNAGTRMSTEISPVGTMIQDDVFYQYYYSKENKTYDPSADALTTQGTAATAVSGHSVSATKPGWYTLKMWDGVNTDAAGCVKEHQIYIDTVTPPSFSFNLDDEQCAGTALTDVEITFTGNAPYSFTLDADLTPAGNPVSSSSDDLTASGSSHSFASPTAAGVYKYKVTALSDKYCVAATLPTGEATRTVNVAPTVKLSALGTICADNQVGIDLSGKLLVDGSTATGGEFSDANGYITAAGFFTPPTPILTADTDIEINVSYKDPTTECSNKAKGTITVNKIPTVTFTLDPTYCAEAEIDLASGVNLAPGTFTAPTGLTLSATNTVQASDMTAWTDYSFSYLYTDANGCDTTVTASTQVVDVPSIRDEDTTQYSISGIQADVTSITGTLGALINSIGVPATQTVQMNWINPDGTDRTDHTESISVTHAVTESSPQEYQAYQTIGTCVGEKVTIPFTFSKCTAVAPTNTKDFFCSQATTKSITLANDGTFEYAWVPLASGATSFVDGSGPSTMTISGDTHTITETAEANYQFYVAAYDAVQGCWSDPATVTFVVKAEPKPTITVPAAGKVSCGYDSNPVAITLLPAAGTGTGYTGVFKVGSNIITGTPEVIPSAYASSTATAELNLTYSVTETISDAGFTPVRECTSLADAKANMYVEYVPAPTITGQTLPVTDFPYKSITVAGTDSASLFNWYLDATATTPTQSLSPAANGAQFDASQGVEYTDDKTIPAYATEVSANGCESEKSTVGNLELVKCPHEAPLVTYEDASTKMAFDECIGNLTAGAPEIKVTNPNLASYSGDQIFYWISGSDTLQKTASASFIPTDLAVKLHELEVRVRDYSVSPKTCLSPSTIVNYEVFGMPDPSFTISDDVLCIYDNDANVQAFDDGTPVSSGTFTITQVSTPILAGSFTIDPDGADFGKGDYIISYEYTNANGCTEKAADKTFEIVEVTIPAPINDVAQYDEMPQFGGQYQHPFKATPTAGNTLEWYREPTDYTADAKSKTNEYGYQFPIPADGADGTKPSMDFNDIYYAHVDVASGCKSKSQTVTLSTTDCPVPAPTVVPADVCEMANSITAVKAVAATQKSEWPGGSAFDPTLDLEYSIGSSNGTYIPGSEYAFSTTDVQDKSHGAYDVYFRAVSDDPSINCESPAVRVDLTVHRMTAPRADGKSTDNRCFGDDTKTATFKASGAVAGISTILWYSGTTNVSSGNSYEMTDPGTVTATIKLNDPLLACESLPISFTFTQSAMVVPPRVQSLSFCATPMAKFPKKNLEYKLGVTHPDADEFIWYDESGMELKRGSLDTLAIPEDGEFRNATVSMLPGDITSFYAIAMKDGCPSEMSPTGTLTLKITPDKPIITNSEKITKTGTVCKSEDPEKNLGLVYTANSETEDETGSMFYWHLTEDYETILALNLDPSFNPITSTADLSLDAYLSEAGEIEFLVVEDIAGCTSDTATKTFKVAPLPVTNIIGEKTLRYCQQYGVFHTIQLEQNEKGNTIDWDYTDDDGDVDEWDWNPEKPYAFEWRYSNVGVDLLVVTETNPTTKCANTDTITLIVAPKTTPAFTYDYYYGKQEIVFRNEQTVDSIFEYITDSTMQIDALYGENYWTKYKWDFVYAEDGSESIRTYDQYPQTTYDSLYNNLYYINKGPNVFFDNVIKTEFKGDPRLVTLSDNLETAWPMLDSLGELPDSVWIKDSANIVTEVDGRTVSNHGGIPFEYGLSRVTLKRSIEGYDSKSCNVTSPEEDVFMKIVTGLYLPTSLVPGHSSPLISVFKPYGYKLKDFKIYVFDNWGNIVWFSDKLDEFGSPVEVWDGRDKEGNMLPADCYIWKVDATFKNGNKWEGNKTTNGKKNTTGSVCLIR